MQRLAGGIELRDDPNLIGRLADCAVVVSDGNTSRHHARITRAGTIWTLSWVLAHVCPVHRPIWERVG